MENLSKRATVDVTAVNMKELPDFITSNTNRFFEITGLGCDFLQQDPALREKNEDSISVKATVSNMRVVNDFAERGVAFIEEYNGLHTTNEEQKQSLILTVKTKRQQHQNRNKIILMQQQSGQLTRHEQLTIVVYSVHTEHFDEKFVKDYCHVLIVLNGMAQCKRFLYCRLSEILQ